MRRDELSLPEPPNNDRPSDRWACGHHGNDAGCAHGPSRSGRCPLAQACTPRRTWQGRRSQLVVFAIAVLVLSLAFLTQPNRRAEILKPGALTTAHAQILSGTDTTNRCAACHPRAATDAGTWFSTNIAGHAEFAAGTDANQTDRCLQCHHVTIGKSNATLAHNLPQQARESIRLASANRPDRSWHDWLPSPSIDQENIQCNACHREHGGAGHDLSAVSDQQCQTCHADRFGHFAHSHPDWNRWPYGRGRRIGFDHAAHAGKHFPSTKQGDGVAQFQCADCHHKTADNELTRVTTFERACKSCHQAGMKIQIAEGLDLFALPSLPDESAKRVGRWPDEAIGFFDGQLGPIAELLMRTESEVERSVRELPDANFGQLDSENPRSVQVAERIARGYQSLLEQISEQGQDVIIDRIEANGISRSSARSFVQSMPTQLVSDATRHWFQQRSPVGVSQRATFEPANREKFRAPLAAKPDDDLLAGDHLPNHDSDLLAGGDDLLAGGDDLLADSDDLLAGGDDLLAGGDDPLEVDPLVANDERSVAETPTRFDADQMLPQGGWYRDELRLAIRYRGGQHADPILKATIDIISQLPSTDPVHRRLLKNEAVAACVACHPGALNSTNQWQSETLSDRGREFTKFSHRPHLNIANLSDCVHCHPLATSRAETNSVGMAKIGDPNDPWHDFAPLGRQVCASCHTPTAAGDSCIKCHRYHIQIEGR